MADLLSVNPSSIDFGQCITGAFVEADIVIRNESDVNDIHIGDITSDNAFFTIPSPPAYTVTLIPGDNITVTVRFLPTSAGVKTGTLSIICDALNNPVGVAMTGEALASGGALSVEPSAWQFPDTQVGQDSVEVLFTITNTGSANVTLNSIAVATGFLLSTNPTPVTLTPTQTAQFGIKFHPLASLFYYEAAGAAIDNGSGVNPLNVPMSGFGIPLVPAYIVTGLTEDVMIGFTSTGGVSTMEKVDPTLPCEEISTLVKMFDFWFPEADFPIRGHEKTTYRLEVYFEDYGDFTLTATIAGKRAIPSIQTLNVSGNQDRRTKTAIFDLQCTDELQELTLACSAGILSLVLLILSIQAGAETVKNT